MTRPSSSNEQPIAAGQVPEGASQGGCSGGQESPVPAASSPFANSERPSEKLREGLSLSERLRSWAQNEEMIDAHYTAHGRDCNEAAIALSATGRSEAVDGWRKGWERYEYLRRLTPKTFTDLWRASLTGGAFDELVDAAIRGADNRSADKGQG